MAANDAETIERRSYLVCDMIKRTPNFALAGNLAVLGSMTDAEIKMLYDFEVAKNKKEAVEFYDKMAKRLSARLDESNKKGAVH